MPATNEAFRNSLHWSLFVVVSVLEPSTGKCGAVRCRAVRCGAGVPAHLPLFTTRSAPAAGAAIFKGLQRLAGTVAMGLLGVGTQCEAGRAGRCMQKCSCGSVA